LQVFTPGNKLNLPVIGHFLKYQSLKIRLSSFYFFQAGEYIMEITLSTGFLKKQ
jgi:hypothetical protein